VADTRDHAWLRGFSDIGLELTTEGLSEAECHECARGVALVLEYKFFGPHPPEYWQGVSAGLAVALGL